MRRPQICDNAFSLAHFHGRADGSFLVQETNQQEKPSVFHFNNTSDPSATICARQALRCGASASVR